MENQGLNDDNATISDVSVEANPSTSSNCPRPNPESQSNNDLGDGNSTEALAKALSSMLTSLIKDYDSKAHDTLASQDLLSSSIDRLTRELDQLLEDAPLPFIMQHAAKFSNVRKRVLSLNLLLKSIQRRVDNIDRMLSVGLQHVNFSWKEPCSLPSWLRTATILIWEASHSNGKSFSEFCSIRTDAWFMVV